MSLKIIRVGLYLCIVIMAIGSLIGCKSNNEKDVVSSTKKQDYTKSFVEKEAPTKEARTNLDENSKDDALQYATIFLEIAPFSKKGLIEQLKNVGDFSDSDIEYALDNCDVDWYAQAVKAAEQYKGFGSVESISDILYGISGFTKEEAEYGAKTVLGLATATEDTSLMEAIDRAKKYLNSSPYSRSRLISIMEHKGYETSEAIAAVDGCGADWNEQALIQAKRFIDNDAFCYSRLYKILIYEEYTEDEAQYAVDNCGADWKEQALEQALSYLKSSSFSYLELRGQLSYEGYTDEEASYGTDNCGADWKEEALEAAIRCMEKNDFSYLELHGQLLYEKYTDEEASYGADNCGADWKEKAVSRAKGYLKNYDWDDERLKKQLLFDKFTDEEVVYAIKNCR